MPVIVSDDFVRANSNTVGNGWTEHEFTASENAIESNSLRMGQDTGTSGARAINQSHGTLVYPASLSYKISALNNGGRRLWTLIESGSTSAVNGMGVGIRFLTNVNNNVSIIHGGGQTRSRVNLSSNTDYWVWIDYTENGSNIDIELYIATSSTKPGSPTLSAINVAKADAGDEAKVSFDVVSIGQDLNIDEFAVSDSSEAGGGAVLPTFLPRVGL